MLIGETVFIMIDNPVYQCRIGHSVLNGIAEAIENRDKKLICIQINEYEDMRKYLSR